MWAFEPCHSRFVKISTDRGFFGRVWGGFSLHWHGTFSVLQPRVSGFDDLLQYFSRTSFCHASIAFANFSYSGNSRSSQAPVQEKPFNKEGTIETRRKRMPRSGDDAFEIRKTAFACVSESVESSVAVRSSKKGTNKK